jgi:hypothetical protein
VVRHRSSRPFSFVEAPFHAAGILERRKMPFSVGARKVGALVKVPRSNA